MRKMNKLNKMIKHISLFLLALTIMLPTSFMQANAAEYDIIFKAGAHGTLNENKEKSVTHSIQSGDVFPNEPVVNVEEGYIFTGWNKELPEAGSTVNGKHIYVAQYDVEINGVSYIVEYQDQEGVIISTSKSAMGELGSTIIERAKVIPEYTFTTSQQEVILTEGANKVIFTYFLTNPNEREIIVEEVTNVTVPGTTGTAGTTGTPTTPQTPTENVEDEDTPLADNPNDNETVEEDDTPLAKGNEKNVSVIIAGAVFATAFIVGLWWFLVKKKKRKQA